MQPLITGAEAGAIDEAAVAAGETWDGLMARAGHGLAAAVLDELRGRTGGVYGRVVHVVVGKGDNGGDGWVAARHLRARGALVTVHAVHGVEVGTSAHSARARAAWRSSGGRVVDGIADDGAAPPPGTPSPDLLVDCVLGTGVSGPLRGAPEVAVRRLLTGHGTPVVAADVPTGLDADTGARAGDEHLVVARTVTFGAMKRGLALQPGAASAGRVDVVDLGPRWARALRDERGDGPLWARSTDRDVRVPALDAGADKQRRGRVLVVAGSRRYAGAGALAAAAAVRVGAGLVTLATSGPTDAVRALEPGVMAVSLPASDDDDAGGPAPSSVERVLALAEDADVAVVGPGCGHGDGTRALADALLAHDLAVVLDADGCNVYRDDVAALGKAEGPLVLTPHHRELARLLGRDDPEQVLADRHEVVPRLAERLPGAVVVGKGPGTVVAGVGDDGRLRVGVVGSGGPALGSGGSGDVLAGLLGGWVAGSGGARDRTGHRAVVAGVHLHGIVGERAGRAAGGRATARDLLEQLPAVLAERAVATSGEQSDGSTRAAGRAAGRER